MPSPRHTAPLLAVWLCAGIVSCGDGGDARRPKPTPRRPDKASVYGDARLVPSRAGEQARRELALAGQVAALVDARVGQPGVAVVDVQLGEARPRVTVSLPMHDEAPGIDVLPDDVDRLVSSVLPGAALTLVAAQPEPEPEPVGDGRGGVPWPLVLALLGFGVSAGVFLERGIAQGVLRLRRDA